VLTGVESLKVFPVFQAEQGRKRNGTFDERGDRSTLVRLLSCRGSRTGQAVGGSLAAFFMSWAMRWMISKGGLKAGTIRSPWRADPDIRRASCVLASFLKTREMVRFPLEKLSRSVQPRTRKLLAAPLHSFVHIFPVTNTQDQDVHAINFENDPVVYNPQLPIAFQCSSQRL
jgi:hypothetical protein